jgi:hypothetical protein
VPGQIGREDSETLVQALPQRRCGYVSLSASQRMPALIVGATALSARDRAVAPFNRGSHHATALSWADGDAATVASLRRRSLS